MNSEELKRWFIQQEVDLFRFKLTKISHDSHFIDKFLKDNDLHYEPVRKLIAFSLEKSFKIDIFVKKISDTEKQSVLESLVEMGNSHAQVNSQSFYRVNFSNEFELFFYF